jgi:cytochrome c-type biogenesis protein CcmH/NrfF
MRVKLISIKNMSTRMALVVCLASGFGVAHASDKLTVIEVARQIVCECPNCGGRTTDQCEPGCKDGNHIKDEITAGIKDGKTAEQIIDFIAQKHGEHMRAAPSSTAAYALPALGIFAGLLPLGLILRSRRKNETTSENSNDAPRVASTQSGASEDPRVAAALKEIDF